MGQMSIHYADDPKARPSSRRIVRLLLALAVIAAGAAALWLVRG